jgi:predicted chitinase
MTDPWQWWTAAQIARATGSPLPAVQENWPLIADALDRRGIYTRDVARGVLATIAIETASTFEPIHEYGTPADWARYSGGARYAGRGFIQLTHDYNYRAAGNALGIDLVNNPDRALDPQTAADILAWYWDTKTIPSKDGTRTYSLVELCEEADWEWVRRAVQGGTNGLDRLRTITTALGDAAVPNVTIPYDPDAKCDVQPDDWSCSIQSTQWLLRSIGRNPGDAWMHAQLVPGIVSMDVGLLDASGQQLANWITREYGAEMGFVAHAAPVTFDDVLAGAGVNPTIVGGRRFGPGGHWVGIRRADADGLLEMANPAPGYQGSGTHLDRAEWGRFGPWSAVFIDRMATAPVPEPPRDPKKDAIVGRLRALLVLHEQYDAAMRAELTKLIAQAEAL